MGEGKKNLNFPHSGPRLPWGIKLGSCELVKIAAQPPDVVAVSCLFAQHRVLSATAANTGCSCGMCSCLWL